MTVDQEVTLSTSLEQDREDEANAIVIEKYLVSMRHA